MMLRTATLAIAVSFVLIPSAAAQQSCGVTNERWGTRGVTQEFVARDQFVYAADGRGVTVYDVSEPRLIRQRNVVYTSRPSHTLRFAGNDLIVATTGGVELFEAGPEGSLTFLDRIERAVSKLAADGQHIVVSDENKLTLLRINGNQLASVVSTQTTNTIDALLLHGSFLFVAENKAAIRVFDISTNRFQQVGLIALQAKAMISRGDRLYLAAAESGVITLDISNPAKPLLLQVVDSAIGDIQAIDIDGDRLVAQNQSNEVRSYALTATGNIIEPAVVREEPSVAILAHDGNVFVAGTLRDERNFPTETGAPIRVLDPATLELRAEFLSPAGGITGAATDGVYAYVADPPVLRIVDLRTSPPREVATVPYNDNSDRVKINEQYAIVYGRMEAHIIDITNPILPRYAGVYHPKGMAPNDVGFSYPYLLEANRASGFHVLDISNPLAPQQLSGAKNDGRGQWFGFSSMTGFVYGMVTKGVRVFDIRNPSVPSIRRDVHYIELERLVDTAIVRPDRPDALLAVLDGTTVRIYALSDPSHPVEISQVAVPPSLKLTADGNLLHVLTKNNVATIDLTNPLSPQLTLHDLNLFSPSQIDAAGRKIVIADRFALHVVELGVPSVASPQLTFTASPNGNAGRLHWTSSVDSQFEVEISTSPDFATVEERITTRGGEAAIALEERRYARVRTLNGCGVNDWSNVVTLDARKNEGIVMETSGDVYFVATGTPLPVPTVTFRNAGATPGSVELSALDPSSLLAPLPPAFTLGAGERRTVSLALTEAARNGGAVDVSINGVSGPAHRIEVRRLTVSEPRTRVQRRAFVLPGAGSLAGLNGTRWRSDLQLLCKGVCELEIGYAASADPGSETSFELALGEGQLVILHDVVALMQRSETSGTINIYGASIDQLDAALYSYNDSPGGKFGQRVLARLDDPARRTSAERSLLLGISSNAVNRTNVGLVNLNGTEAFATLTLRTVDGAAIAKGRFGLPPFASLQLPVATLAAIDDGSLLVESESGVLAFSSRVDQKTGDATFSWGVPLTPSLQRAWTTRVGTFPLVGSIDGGGDSQWKTDLQVANLMPAAGRFRMSFIPVTAPHNAIFSDVTIEGGAILSATPASIFPSLAHGQLGSIRIESDSSFTGWSRLYNESAAGTYGQFMPLRSTSQSVLVTQSIVPRQQPATIATLFPVAESSDERTNLTLIERGGRDIAVALSVYDAQGTLLAVSRQHLRPFDTLFINRVLSTLGIEGVTAARIDVDAGDGNVDAVGSVVQGKTNDAVTITTDGQ